MLIHWDIKQNTPEWHAVRLGKLTASKIDQIITPARLKPSASAKGLALKLLAEQFGEKKPNFSNYYTDRGHELEPEAAQWYAYTKGLELHEVGFVERDDSMYGSSPDRVMIDDNMTIDSGLEIKCLSFSEHVDILESGKIPGNYLLQTHGNMIACECDTWVFLAYHPNCKQQFVKVIERNEVTEAISRAIYSFVDMIEELKEKYVL